MSQPGILLPTETKSGCFGKSIRIDKVSQLCLLFYWNKFCLEMSKAGQMVSEHFIV